MTTERIEEMIAEGELIEYTCTRCNKTTNRDAETDLCDAICEHCGGESHL